MYDCSPRLAAGVAGSSPPASSARASSSCRRRRRWLLPSPTPRRSAQSAWQGSAPEATSARGVCSAVFPVCSYNFDLIVLQAYASATEKGLIFHNQFNRSSTVLVLRMTHRKWKETKQQPSMLSGPAVPGCCLVSFHILWAILSTSTVHCKLNLLNSNPF